MRLHAIVSHFKRASNHNERDLPSPPAALLHISKEHQITTLRHLHRRERQLLHISKEHQITTSIMVHTTTLYCFTFQKSIKSQLPARHRYRRRIVSHFKRASNHNEDISLRYQVVLFHISKEHQITTPPRMSALRRRLFHISKEHQIIAEVAISIRNILVVKELSAYIISYLGGS